MTYICALAKLYSAKKSYLNYAFKIKCIFFYKEILCDITHLILEVNKVTQHFWVYWAAQLVKKPPAVWNTWAQSLGWEDPLERGKATHSSILALRIPWTV